MKRALLLVFALLFLAAPSFASVADTLMPKERPQKAPVTSITNEAVLINDEALNGAVANLIGSMSKELEQKTGVKTGVLIGKKSLQQMRELLRERLESASPAAFLLFDIESKSYDLFLQHLELDGRSLLQFYYLKWGVLPAQGSVLPLLSDPKNKDIYNSAAFNGFDDLLSKIEDKYEVKLEREKSFARTNDTLINLIRFVFYAAILLLFFFYVKRRLRS